MATQLNEQLVYQRPETLSDVVTHYCPGCTHGIAHRLVAEVIDELGIREKTIGVAPVGCSVFCYNYFECDFAEAAHGRAPAMATGLKRVMPDKVVFTYQGDGDLASIGLAEIMHAALRGENITVIFINNAIYGMTGGQMAPTTLPGQKTTSSPNGRDVETSGFPIKMSELIAQMQGATFVARRSGKVVTVMQLATLALVFIAPRAVNVSRMTSCASGSGFKGADSERQAELQHLDELSRRLAELAGK